MERTVPRYKGVPLQRIIEAVDKAHLTHGLGHLLDHARGLPVVMNSQGPWAVLWGPGYEILTLELECCRFSFPNLEALPSENMKCPHGNWIVLYG